MMRIAWPNPQYATWTGGLNYFSNLARAYASVPESRFEIVLLGEKEPLPAPLDGLAHLTLSCMRRYAPQRVWDKVLRGCSESGGLRASSLARNNISLLSHSHALGLRSPVPALCWIPDFQDVYLPEFFTAKELRHRAAWHARLARSAQGIMLSSHDAHKDFCRLFPEAAHKAHVLHFVAHIPAEAELPPAAEVLQAYAIAEPYFHLPNQLWAHKNHRLVLEALRLLHAEERCPLVISTGQTDDYRNPKYFGELRNTLYASGLEERFRFLGRVPFAHVAVLMRNAVALINPSRFEGWSTTVEEAKSAGKKILLSDLAVHREQNPPRGEFFGVDDAATLAGCMLRTLQTYDPTVEAEAQEQAAVALPERMCAYGLAYEKLALAVIAEAGRVS